MSGIPSHEDREVKRGEARPPSRGPFCDPDVAVSAGREQRHAFTPMERAEAMEL